MKLVISDSKTGKTYQVDVPKDKEGTIVGVKIGDTIDGGFAGLDGYTLQVTGGSDKDGIPMRRDVSGGRKIYAVLSSGAGVRTTEKGERRRKAVRGNVITAEIAQLNTKVTQAGAKTLDELAPKKAKDEKKR